MKWPLSLTIIRHGQSAYNVLRDKKKADPEYQEFVKWFDSDKQVNGKMMQRAMDLQKRYSTGVSDYDTPLTEEGQRQATETGKHILNNVPMPDVIFISPYKRTRATFEWLWAHGITLPSKGEIKVPPFVYDDRIREQEHGLSLLYNDWRIFQTMHPEQRRLYNLQGPYWYQFPQGESVSMVRERIRSFLTMLVREYAGKHVWLVSHHLTLLSIRSTLERLSPEQFMDLDNNEKPINCGVTLYLGDPKLGSGGKLLLAMYNRRLY